MEVNNIMAQLSSLLSLYIARSSSTHPIRSHSRRTRKCQFTALLLSRKCCRNFVQIPPNMIPLFIECVRCVSLFAASCFGFIYGCWWNPIRLFKGSCCRIAFQQATNFQSNALEKPTLPLIRLKVNRFNFDVKILKIIGASISMALEVESGRCTLLIKLLHSKTDHFVNRLTMFSENTHRWMNQQNNFMVVVGGWWKGWNWNIGVNMRCYSSVCSVQSMNTAGQQSR